MGDDLSSVRFGEEEVKRSRRNVKLSVSLASILFDT